MFDMLLMYYETNVCFRTVKALKLRFMNFDCKSVVDQAAASTVQLFRDHRQSIPASTSWSSLALLFRCW